MWELGKTCGSGLARDRGDAVFQGVRLSNRGDAIAGKRAPTVA